MAAKVSAVHPSKCYTFTTFGRFPLTSWTSTVVALHHDTLQKLIWLFGENCQFNWSQWRGLRRDSNSAFQSQISYVDPVQKNKSWRWYTSMCSEIIWMLSWYPGPLVSWQLTQESGWWLGPRTAQTAVQSTVTVSRLRVAPFRPLSLRPRLPRAGRSCSSFIFGGPLWSHGFGLQKWRSLPHQIAHGAVDLLLFTNEVIKRRKMGNQTNIV